VLPYAKELLLGRYETGSLGTLGMKALLRLQTFATELPTQLSQVLLDLEGGKFTVNVASEELERIHAGIKGLGMVGVPGLFGLRP
jgi:ubiquinone biosynthesis protein